MPDPLKPPASGSPDPPVSVLRPSATEAARAWHSLVTAEREQVERLPDRPRPEDFYAPVAEAFAADPRRMDDPLLEILRPLVQAHETWLDVGAGGGRYTLPLALRARHVFAVEPSPGMIEVLRRGCATYGIDNLQVFEERWPSPTAAPVADVGFISHVGYDIADFAAFLDQLEAHSRLFCVAVMFRFAPISDVAPLWRPVHGQERALLPGLAEFVALLFARGRAPELRLLSLPPHAYPTIDAMHAAARRPLWVREHSDADQRLRLAVEQFATPVEDGFALSNKPRDLGLVTWKPRQ